MSRKTTTITRTGLGETTQNVNISVDVAQLLYPLSTLLGSELFLIDKIRLYHWNIEGNQFIPIHELYGDHAKKLFDFTDEIAEQIRKSFVYIQATSVRERTPRLALSEISETNSLNIPNSIADLIQDHTTIIDYINETLSTQNYNLAIQNLLGNVLDFHLKARWFLNSSLNRTTIQNLQ